MKYTRILAFILYVGIAMGTSSILHAEEKVFPSFSPTPTSFSTSASISSGTGSAGLEIDRIDLLGVKSVASEWVERTLELNPGDRLERLKVIRTEENLQNLYRLHGYEKVRIQSRLVRRNERKADGKTVLETVLEFQVTEGDPTRIAGVRLIAMDSKDEAAARARRCVGAAALGLRVGRGHFADRE